ncbi:hypothetical protein JHK85_017417 [Glycine max]|nr:hypothetical protein JHK85_017417 [Glycine max]
MGFQPLNWYCRPAENSIWAKAVDSAFGSYTPCAINTLVISISNLVLVGLCLYRIWLITCNAKAQRFCLSSNCYSYLLGMLAAYCAVQPILRLLTGNSAFNLNGETEFAPVEITTLIVEALTWSSMITLILLETKVLFGTLLFVYIPDLVPYSGHTTMQAELPDHGEYEPLCGDDQVCPERHANIFSRICFGWITPLMKQGYRKPITEKDVWKLDEWDRTETLTEKFQKCWMLEFQSSNPWLLRALNSSLGKRFWMGGIFKIGNDLSQFVGPILLNHLLDSMQRGDPSWIGYIYAFSIFVGVAVGVLCEAQYFQNVMRVGFRLRSTLVAAIFRKSLRLTNDGRKNFPSGRLMNMITSDANALQQICQQLHGLWSAPFRITVAIVLLYQQLGVASLIGSLMLVLIIPLQASFVTSFIPQICVLWFLLSERQILGKNPENPCLAALDIFLFFV